MNEQNHTELLNISNMWVSYDSVEVLKGVNISLEEGEIVCLAGKNGTGKSTMLKAISGLLPVNNGEILFKNENITNIPTRNIIQKGIGMLLQNKEVFPRLKIIDHLKLAAENNQHYSFSNTVNKIRTLFPHLDLDRLAGKLSGGERRQLGFAMLLAQGADKLWLLDEPSAGVSPNLVKNIMSLIEKINQELGVSILMVEQNLKAAKKISTRLAVLEQGKVYTKNSKEEILING